MKVGDIVLIYCINKYYSDDDFKYIMKIGKVIALELGDFDVFVKFADENEVGFFKDEIIKINKYIGKK